MGWEYHRWGEACTNIRCNDLKVPRRWAFTNDLASAMGSVRFFGTQVITKELGQQSLSAFVRSSFQIQMDFTLGGVYPPRS